MVLYFVESMDWNEYVNIKEEITYKVVEIVERHGAEFAYPTQTVYFQPSMAPTELVNSTAIEKSKTSDFE